MSPLYVVLVFAGGVAYALIDGWRKDRGKTAPRPATEGFAEARPGKTPYPLASIVDLPGGAIRLIDVRAMPAEDLQIARFGVVQQQLALERIMMVQLWIVDLETARGWAAMSQTARILLPDRLVDPRTGTRGARNLLYVHGGALSEAEGGAFDEVGIERVTSMTNLSDPPRALDSFLTTRERWQPSPDDRPVPPYKVISTGPFDGDLIHVLTDFSYVDLRRAAPDAIRSGVALARIEQGLGTLAAEHKPQRLAWVASPWVLELLGDEQVERIGKAVDAIDPGVQQRLAIVAPAGEPVPDHALMRRIGARARPLSEALHWRTKDRGAFVVTPIDALHDAYFAHAHKQARL